MSHTANFETDFKDSALLLESLKAMGFHPEVSAHAVPLMGWMGKPNGQRAEIIIRRKELGRLSADAGFTRQADGSYLAMVDESSNPGFMSRLRATYAEKDQTRELARMGYRMAGRKVVNGKIKLQFVKA